MVTLAGIGSALTGVGNIASALGLGKKGPSRTDVLRHEYIVDNTKVRRLANDAKKAGLHPLAALGVQGYTGSFGASVGSAATGSSIGDGLSEAGRTLSRIQARKEEKAKMVADAELAKKESQLLDAQIAESTSRTVLNQANARRTLVGPQAPEDPYAMRKENALIQVKLENGDEVLIPNPDVYEIGPTELATGRILLEGGRVVSTLDGMAEKASPPPLPGTRLGQVVRRGDFEYQWTRNGWKGPRPRRD